MDVGLALRNTSKGQIKYDKFWVQEGRTKEVLDGISEFSTNISLSISPKLLKVITTEVHYDKRSDESEATVNFTISPPRAGKHKVDTNTIDSYFYELQTETELPILEYEEGRLKYIQDTFDTKKHEFESHSRELQQQVNQEYQLLKRNNELDAKRRVGEFKKIEQAILDEARKLEILQREQYQTHVKKLSAKVLEAEMKQRKAEEELRKRQQEQLEFRVQLSNCQQEAQNLISKSIEKLNSCEHPKCLRFSFDERNNQMAKILQLINGFIEKEKIEDLTIEDVLNANHHVKEAYETFHDILNDVETAKAKALQNQDKLHSFSFKENLQSHNSSSDTDISTTITGTSLAKEAVSNIASSSEIKKDDKTSVVVANRTVDEVDKSKEEKKMLLSLIIAPDTIEHHHRIMENLKHVENLLQPFKTDPKNKKCRFELQKAINVPINSLSSNSGSQIKVKVNRLLSILSGKVPETQGLNLSSDSAVYSFCTHLIAKQFVEQGDAQISSQHSTAFPIALAILGVWNKKPDVGSLILAHLYTNCPYLVPYYPPREEGKSNMEYYTSLGYHFDDEGNMEEQYKFLNRMSGYMRLYAAIIVSSLPPNVDTPHPHGISHGWKWLSRILNLDPRSSITATLLYDFLETAGYCLQKSYGKQFKKILHILCKDYFQKIKQVTPGGSGGPIERLETFLQQTVRTGRIPRPEGILEAGFWNK